MTNNVEIERKFIIKLPNLAVLKELSSYTESEIEQIYLDSPCGRTHRIRKRNRGGKCSYTETEKIRIDEISAFENEREITKEEYLALSKRQKSGTHPIIKRRLTLEYDGFVFEIDVYPEWEKTCIMEVEMPKREANPALPPFIEVVEEVTGKKEYSNAKMAVKFPVECL